MLDIDKLKLDIEKQKNSIQLHKNKLQELYNKCDHSETIHYIDNIPGSYYDESYDEDVVKCAICNKELSRKIRTGSGFYG